MNTFEILNNSILDTDSYKLTHPLQYPPGTQEIFSYIESRGGRFDSVTFFGAQILVKKLAELTVTHEMVDFAKDFTDRHIGPNIFPEAGWRRVVDVHKGKIPLEICAVREGTIVPNHNVLMTVRSTDEELFWMVSWFETQLMRIWYPITVATISTNIKKVIYNALLKTSDEADIDGLLLNTRLHDFGSRGVSSAESAGIGGAAHLANFWGSDTIEGILYANHYYHVGMSGISIPAAEHSTITTWGKTHEADAFRMMLNKFTTPLVAVVSDSYDIYNAVSNLWGTELKQEVIDSGKLVVIRPDSGDPPTIVLDVVKRLAEKFGTTTNHRGYKLLNNVRVIQGDGIEQDSIQKILDNVIDAGFAADNIAFGMGGALLQKLDRDTQKFAMKCSAARINDKWVEIFKDPVTDSGKRSKAGLLDLVYWNGKFQTINRLNNKELIASELHLIYQNGRTLSETNLKDIRVRINAQLIENKVVEKVLCYDK